MENGEWEMENEEQGLGMDTSTSLAYLKELCEVCQCAYLDIVAVLGRVVLKDWQYV